MKTLTVRLDDHLAQQLEAVCVVDGRSQADFIRTAIRRRIREKLQEPEFQERLASTIEVHLKRLEGLQ